MTFLSKTTNVLLTEFVIIFFSGFLLVNSILICASSIPLFLYLMEVFIAPIKVQIKKTGLPSSTRLGEIIEVKITGKITGGPGAVVICDDVPKYFQLVEGSNYKVISKDFREKMFSFSYKMRCSKCGNYLLGLGCETRHVFGLTRNQFSREKEIKQLSVSPMLPKIRKMKLPVRMTRKVHPTESIAKIGPLSTDFKEIRNYFHGDPFKIINWKASARAAGWGKLYPLVNEFEREGKVPIWIFLDANPDLIIGTSVENTLEYGIWTAYNISNFFLGKGYNVGMYIYNHRGEILQLDTGKRQFIKIAENLLKLSPQKEGLQVFWDEGFSHAVDKNRKYLVAQSPGIVIITHVTAGNWNDLLNGLNKILIYKRRKRQQNVLVVNILPYDSIPKVNNLETFAAQMLDVASRSFSNRLRNLGLTVLDWDPTKDRMDEILFTTILLR